MKFSCSHHILNEFFKLGEEKNQVCLLRNTVCSKDSVFLVDTFLYLLDRMHTNVKNAFVWYLPSVPNEDLKLVFVRAYGNMYVIVNTSSVQKKSRVTVFCSLPKTGSI
jgi:hypothetical protein